MNWVIKEFLLNKREALKNFVLADQKKKKKFSLNNFEGVLEANAIQLGVLHNCFLSKSQLFVSRALMAKYFLGVTFSLDNQQATIPGIEK